MGKGGIAMGRGAGPLASNLRNAARNSCGSKAGDTFAQRAPANEGGVVAVRSQRTGVRATKEASASLRSTSSPMIKALQRLVDAGAWRKASGERHSTI